MKREERGWVSVVEAADFGAAEGRAFQVGEEQIAVFRVGDGFCATEGRCPHQGGPLADGVVEDGVVRCPWHDWRYDLRSGCPVATPSLTTYPVRVVDGQIQIELPSTRQKGSRDATDDVSAEEVVPSPLQPLLSELQGAMTLGHVMDVLASGLKDYIPHDRIGVAMLDGRGDRLIQVATRSTRHILLGDGFAASIQGSSLRRLLDGGDVRIIDDLTDVLARRPSSWTRMLVDEGMRSNLTLPLRVHHRPIGVLFLSSTKQKGFDESHVGMLKQIAGQLAASIEKGHWVTDLAQSNERYKILFEMLHEGVFTCESPDVPFATIHPNLAAWLSEDVAALKQRRLLSLLAPDAVARFRQELKALRRDGGSRVFETTWLRQDGGLLPIELRLTQIEQQGRPFLMGFVHNLSEVKALNARLHEQQQQRLGALVGESPAMQRLYDLVEKVAPLPTTVLITGESGTGKELFARAIHQRSQRAEHPMVTVNCGALHEGLLETEWFGHEKGAFTGAVEARKGRFELADGGTIFLDEIGELSPANQIKLLRVLQEGEFQRVGSSETRRTDVRVIAATHRDLKAAVEAGSFREDLYYRLHVVRLEVPPLRKRKDDLPLLIKAFIEKLNARTHKAIQRVSEEALVALLAYEYPGNVRQLENIMEHAFVLCQSSVIDVAHLPPELTTVRDDLVELALREADPLAALERELIQRVLKLTDGNQRRAAERLGISRTTLWRKLKTHT